MILARDSIAKLKTRLVDRPGEEPVGKPQALQRVQQPTADSAGTPTYQSPRAEQADREAKQALLQVSRLPEP